VRVFTVARLSRNRVPDTRTSSIYTILRLAAYLLSLYSLFSHAYIGQTDLMMIDLDQSGYHVQTCRSTLSEVSSQKKMTIPYPLWNVPFDIPISSLPSLLSPYSGYHVSLPSSHAYTPVSIAFVTISARLAHEFSQIISDHSLSRNSEEKELAAAKVFKHSPLTACVTTVVSFDRYLLSAPLINRSSIICDLPPPHIPIHSNPII
jgi:hypothetical protein